MKQLRTVATIFNCQRTPNQKAARPFSPHNLTPKSSFTTVKPWGVCYHLRPSVGPVRATSLERLLDQHKVCRNSLLVGAQGGRLMLTAGSLALKGGKGSNRNIPGVFLFGCFLSWPFSFKCIYITFQSSKVHLHFRWSVWVMEDLGFRSWICLLL